MRAEPRVARIPTWWNERVRRLTADIGIPAGLLAVDLINAVRHGWHFPGILVDCAADAILLARRRFPLVMLPVVAVCLVTQTNVLPQVFALYAIAAFRGPGLITLTGTLGLGALTAVRVLSYPENRSISVATAILGAFVFGPVLVGLWVFQRATLLRVLRERAEEAERTRNLLAQQAVSAERRHIAREMHDVVGHRVTAIALQAGALAVRAPDERTATTAETIRSLSAAALAELRGILRVLRDDAQETEVPSWRTGKYLLSSIESLVANVVATGARVELDLPGPLPEVSDQLQRAVYRVVQESLTNAGKHAPHAAVRVAINATDTDLTVEVTNLLAPTTASVPGSGYGLIGMRERVELAGGQLQAGRANDSFRVLARFPLPTGSAEQETS